jgi:hypothetical protein
MTVGRGQTQAGEMSSDFDFIISVVLVTNSRARRREKLSVHAQNNCHINTTFQSLPNLRGKSPDFSGKARAICIRP